MRTLFDRVEQRLDWVLRGSGCADDPEQSAEDVRLLLNIAKAAEDGYHADLHGHGHFYEADENRPDCAVCVALAEVEEAP